MSLYEKTVYPQLAEPISADELVLDFTPTEEEIEFCTRSARQPASRLTLLVLLKLFQKLHRFPNTDEVPVAVVDHLRIRLRLGAAIVFEHDHPVQRARQRHLIREYTGFAAWSKEARHVAAAAGYEAALIMGRAADITNAVIGALTNARFELPPFAILERTTRHARALAHRKLCGNVFARLTAEERQALDRLLVIPVDQRRTAVQRIKRLPQRPSRKHLKESVDHLEWLESLGSVGTELKDIAPSLIHDFAKQARTTDAGELKDFTPAKRYTLLLCLIHRTRARTRDAVAGTFVKRISTIHKRAKNELMERQLEQRERVDRLLGRLGEVIHIVANEKSDAKIGQQVRTTLTQAEPIESLQEEYSTAKNWTGNNYLPLLWRHYKGNRPVLFRAIKALKVSSATQDNSLIEVWNLLCDPSNHRADWIPVESELLHFASARWRTLLKHPTDPALVNRRQLEVCVQSYIGDHLQAGNLCVPGSEAFADHRAELLPWPECEQRLPEYCERLGMPATGNEFVSDLQRQLAEFAKRVDEQFPQNTTVKMGADGLPVLLKYSARVIPESAQRLHIEVMRRMPQRSLLDILVNVEHLTNFTNHFGPASDSEPKIERAAERYLLTIFAIGSSLGPVQAARHLGGVVTARMLSFANRKHVTVEKLEASRRELIEFYLTLDLPKAWGKGTMVAADGTQFDFYDNNLLAGYHFRYRKMGAVAYRHVADNYIAVFGHFMPPGLWEGIHVIDALQQPPLSIQTDTVCSDTQGQSAVGFAFARMFGIRLLPRIRNWKNLKLYRPRANARYRHLDSLFRATVDWKLLRRHWKDWMQLVLSVQAGRIPASTLIRQLSHRSDVNTLSRFAEQLGNVDRTIFLLEWISNQPMRQEVTAMTNKVEGYHSFSKWLRFGGEVVAENDPDEQQKYLRYNDLLASAVILQNVIDMSQIIADLRREGWTITEEDLSLLSPYLTPGVKRFGEYGLDFERELEPSIQQILSRRRSPLSKDGSSESVKEA
jgi:TnpA family transposase